MKKAIALILCFVMALLVCGCNDFPKSEADLNESQVPSEYKTSHTANKQIGEAKLSLYYDMNLIIAVNYPQFEYNELNNLVIEAVNSMRGSFAELAKGFTAKRFRNRGTLYVDYETFLKDDIISVVFYTTTKNIDDESQNELVKTIVYDRASNRQITFQNYFRSSSLSYLNGIASEEVAKVAKSQGIGDYTFSNIEEFSKFAVKTDGVEFYFSKNDLFSGKKSFSFKVMNENIEDYVVYGKIDPNKPMVAVTFDDGPGAYTDKVLDIMEKYGARCTFFMVGENLAESKASLLKRAVSLDCEIGAHSRHHSDLSKKSATDAADDMEYVIKEIETLSGGYKPAVYRPPYGAYTKAMIKELKSRGYSGINWSIDTLDWKYRDSSWVVSQATGSSIHDGDIILMHDIHKTTVDAVEDIVKGLQSQGFQLITVSELMEQRGVEVEDKPVLACYKN